MRRRELRALLKAWGCDTRGVAAVEFAFIAPILILLYFSMVEFCQAYMAQKRTGHVASVVADLVSQTDALTKQQVLDLLDVGEVIISPFPKGELRQRVSSVSRVTSTKYNVDWSVGKGRTGKLTVTDAEVPSDMLAIGESVIVAEAEYDYRSPFSNMLPEAIRIAPTFKRMAYLRPRTAEIIACTGC